MEITLAISAYCSFLIFYYFIGVNFFIKVKSNKVVANRLAIFTWLACLIISAYVGEFVANYNIVAVIMFIASFVFFAKAQQHIKNITSDYGVNS